MSEISKQALQVENSTSFPNNNTGYISPAILRAYNTDVIDSTVNQTVYTADSSSWNSKISSLQAFTSSQQPSFTALNAFTASQAIVNTNLNAFTQSANASISKLDTFSSSFNAYTASINQIRSNGITLGTSTIFNLVGPGTFFSASLVQNIQGNIATLTFTSDNGKVNTSSFNEYTASTAASQSLFSASVATSFSSSNATFNLYTASTNAFTASAQTSINQLLNFSSSLDATFATDAQLSYSASVLQANIDTKVNTASFNSYTASQSNNNTGYNSFTSSANVSITNLNLATASLQSQVTALGNKTGSYATTGSNTFIGTETITGSLVITGSVYQNVSASSITAQTASIDLSVANYFTLTLSGSANINVLNPQPGITATLVINTSTNASASFSNNVKQPSGSFYAASPSGNIDIISFTAVNSNTIYAFPAQSFI